jgi:hypothetical protein
VYSKCIYTDYSDQESIVEWVKASVAVCALAAIGVSGTAEARVVVGVGIGVPVYPYYYPAAPVPYYYPAPVVEVPADSPTYVEQGQPAPEASGPQLQAGTWYYCDAAKAYYPYVKQCAGGWRAVPASPR